MAYSFQNVDGSIDFDKLNSPAKDRLLANGGGILRPAVVDTHSGLIQDSGCATTSVDDAFSVAMRLRPVKNGEAVAIVLESRQQLLLCCFHQKLEDTAINPDV